ncbi:hypothetical protein [Variovorax sp.]|uniref:hypothetical protein n=1 Tax=Variovorax sp. TaxID=1871043 RepID=UPI002D2CBD6A|nr:hypothetical protein [Variovorax sp.]HYP83905.1 hypothetical protein [Variovorax sp.]
MKSHRITPGCLRTAGAALALLGASLLAACATGNNAPAASAGARVGADRDSHGCMASAGYQWCEHAGRCERPWELARKEGFATENFNAYCSAAPRQ